MAEPFEYERQTFDPRVFFAEHWRQKPLLVRGGARDFLGMQWPAARFDEARAQAGDRVKERPGEVTFIEEISVFDPELLHRAVHFAEFFGTARTWFDAIRTYSGGAPAARGIGAHFDHSDNFVLQQSGVKNWQLASPDHLTRQEVAGRMMNVPGVGSHEMPEDGLVEVTLQAGDLMYIPLLWLHSGLSNSDSLSLSLVCPAISLHAVVFPLLMRALREGAVGYQPAPALHAHLSTDERDRTVATLERATRALLGSVSGPEMLAAVQTLQSAHLPGLRESVS